MDASAEVRILVADDEPRVRHGYATFFGSRPGFVLVGQARTGGEAVDLFEVTRPDVVLMDLQMPVMTGSEATKEICRRWPGACVVAMTTFGSREYVAAALRAGAAGYLLKDAGGAALVAAVHQALAGEMPLSSAVRRELVASMVGEPDPPEAPAHGLTPREVELMGWLAHGMTNQQIAVRMHVSEGSVKQYLARVGEKWDIVSRTQMLVRAIQLGVVDPNALST